MSIPFRALRAFEATARLGSFAKAAGELGVTPAAIGQQVRGLETDIGTQLFVRSATGLAPTERARESLPILRHGLASLHGGFRALKSEAGSRKVRISVAPTFAVKWLVPRLPGFYERHPEIELTFDTTMRLLDIAAGEADLAIRFGPGSYRALCAERLFGEWVLPVCTPDLADKSGPFHNPADLRGAAFIHLDGETTDTLWPTWPEWAKRFGLDVQDFESGPRFTQSATTLETALSGQGVALAGLSFSLDDLEANRLIAPLGTQAAIRTRYGYDVVYPRAKADQPALRKFRRWIRRIADDTRIGMERFLSLTEVTDQSMIASRRC